MLSRETAIMASKGPKVLLQRLACEHFNFCLKSGTLLVNPHVLTCIGLRELTQTLQREVVFTPQKITPLVWLFNLWNGIGFAPRSFVLLSAS